jgi:peptidylprolyl isomerase
MGLEKEMIIKTTGEMPRKGQKVVIDYEGFLRNGAKFDSSYARREPFVFKLGVGEVIDAWDMAVGEMRVGEKVRITATPDLAYGHEGVRGAVPQDSDVIFVLELIDFY